MLKECGYEVDGFKAYFNIKRQFLNNIDNIVSNELYKLYSVISAERLHKDRCA
jgi:hypothetical protein